MTILIVNWNGKRFLKGLFESLASTTYENYEILIVDNGSTEGDGEILRQMADRYSNLRLVCLASNLGFAGGNNVGLRQLPPDTRYVCFLNSDVLVEPGWLEPLVTFLEEHPDAGIVQPKLLRPENHRKIDRAVLTVDRLGYDVYDIFTDREDGPDLDAPCPVFSVSGAAFLVRRSLLDQVSFGPDVFDPSYFTYFEETDLCWRARLTGAQIWFCPASRVYHYRGGATRPTGAIPPPLVFHHTKNRLSSLLKNYSLGNVALWLPLLVGCESFRALATTGRNRDHSREILRGIRWVFDQWDEIMLRREFVQRNLRKVSDRQALKLMALPNPLRLLRNFGKVYQPTKIPIRPLTDKPSTIRSP